MKVGKRHARNVRAAGYQDLGAAALVRRASLTARRSCSAAISACYQRAPLRRCCSNSSRACARVFAVTSAPASIRASSSIRAPPDELRQLARHLRRGRRSWSREMMIRVRGDLRQMRHAQHLARVRRAPAASADGRRHGAADAGVHFVEHERRDVADFARHDLDRERDARQLAAGRDARQRAGGCFGWVATRIRPLRARSSRARHAARARLRSGRRPSRAPASPRLRACQRTRRRVVRFAAASRGRDRTVFAPPSTRWPSASAIRRFGELGQARASVSRERGQLVGLRTRCLRAMSWIAASRSSTRASSAGSRSSAPQIVAQRARRFVELDRRRLQQRDDIGERRIVRHSPAADFARAARAVARARRRRRSTRLRLRRRRDEPGGVGEPALAAVRARTIRSVRARAPQARAAARRGSRARRRLPRRQSRPRRAARRRRATRATQFATSRAVSMNAAECVQQLALRFRACQRLVRVLAVQVEQLGAECGELRQASPAGR